MTTSTIHWDEWLSAGAPLLDAESVNPEAGASAVAAIETIHSPRDAVEQLGAIVWRFLRQLGVATHELEDLHQEVFVTAIAKWSDFRGQSLRKSWILGIALNKARNQMRKYRHRRFREALAVDAEELDHLTESGATLDFGSDVVSQDPSETVARRQAAQFVERTVSVLSEEERAVFLLVVVEGLGVPEVVPILELGSRRVHTILERVRRVFDAEIRKHLAPKNGGRHG